MECMINLIVFSLIVVCSGNTVNIPINQHKCVVQGSSIECRFTVPGVYSPDRLLSTISSVEFDFFGKGCIQIEQKQMPDLTMVKIKQADDWKAVCLNIHVEQRVKVVVAGRECSTRQGTTRQTSQKHFSQSRQPMTDPETTPGDSHPAPPPAANINETTFLTFKIAAIILAGPVSLFIYFRFILIINCDHQPIPNRQPIRHPQPIRHRQPIRPRRRRHPLWNHHIAIPLLRRADRNRHPPMRFQAGQ